MNDESVLLTVCKHVMVMMSWFGICGCETQSDIVSELHRDGVVVGPEERNIIGASFSQEANCCHDAKVFSQAIASLQKLRGLKRLTVFCPDFTDERLNELTTLNDIKRLQFDFCGLTDDATQMLSRIQTLEEVYFESCVKLKGGDSFQLGSLRNLHTLSIKGCGFRLRDTHLSGGFPSLTVLALSATLADDESLTIATQIKSLRELNLNQTRVTNESFSQLKKLPALERLVISTNRQINDTSVGELISLTSLKYLDICNTHISSAGHDRLLKALPNTRIHWYESKEPRN